MMWLVIVLAAIAVSGAVDIHKDDVAYYSMPPIYQLDDYEACLSRVGAVFCMGDVVLVPAPGGEQLMESIEEYSNDVYYFNHTVLKRGLCLTSRYPNKPHDQEYDFWFEQSLNDTLVPYNLSARLKTLHYCKVGGEPRVRPVDEVDWYFAYIVMAILGFNVLGTLYDLSKNPETKPIKAIQAWSLVQNWERFTATYEKGDPRLSALNPLQAMKFLTTMLVLQAHAMFQIYMSYVYNPRFLEDMGTGFYATGFYNGSLIVQTFIMVSAFLYAYNFLYHVVEKNPKGKVKLSDWPMHFIHRVARIVPVYMFMVGLMGTWWRFLGDSALWTPLVELEAETCRDKWWSHVLFIHNFYKPDDRCLLQSWFLAVDMQLYIITSLAMLLLAYKRKVAMQVFAALFFAFILLNGCLSYVYDLRAMIFLARGKIISIFFRESDSFNWLYAAPWGSASAAFLGLFNAFLYHRMETSGFKFNEHWYCRLLYRMSVPLMVFWVYIGHAFQDCTDPVFMAVYTALDRPVFALFVSFCMIGMICKCDSLIWRFMSWPGWRLLGRLSLPALMLHWSINLTLTASRSNTFNVSIVHCLSEWFSTICLTYVFSVPLHLLLELPAQRFFQAIVS